MRAGRLDRLIDIQRATPTLSTSGEPILTWTNLASRRAASITPVQGGERFADPQIMAPNQVEFRIRYASDIDDLSPKDRIIYPALDVTSPETPPAENEIYNIVAINEIGRREGLSVIAKRHADAA